MKRFVPFTIGIFAFALLGAQAQNVVLFSTTNDFSQWSGNAGSTVAADPLFSADTVSVDGVGNITTPGGSDTSGSLSITWANSVGAFNTIAGAPSEGGNSAFLSAIDPGSSGNNSVAYSGVLYLDYSLPDPGPSGTYFSLGILLQYAADGYFQTFFPTATTDLGFQDANGQEVFQATIPYTISAGNFNGFGFSIMYNSNYTPSHPFHVDAISVLAPVAPPTPPPVYPLFSTSDDFGQYTSAGGDLIQSDNTWNVGNNTTNGLGNTTSPGTTGTAGSLLLFWSGAESTFGTIAQGPDEEFNVPFMQTIDPGCDTGTETSVPAYGNIYLTYSQPDNTGGGNYFQVGVNLQYAADGYFGVFFPSTTTDLHIQDNSGYEVFQATIPYTINAGNFYGFALSVAINSNYQPTNGFHISSITASAAQLPLLTSASLSGTNLVIRGTNALGGTQFTLHSTTNLALPLSQWSAAGAGTFGGPLTFSNVFTINPASQRAFYRVSVP